MAATVALLPGCSGDQSLGGGLPPPDASLALIDANGLSDAGSRLDADASPGSRSCPTLNGAPTPLPPTPSAPQVAFQREELSAFVHLGLETFDGTEHGASTDTASLFSPSNLDTSQWATAFKDAGFREVTLVAKHETGFCLWPSAYTDYSVKSSPWKGGQGDVVREFVDAMHAVAMDVGLYVSALDQRYPSTGAGYDTYFRNQVTELLTGYGPIAELYVPGNDANTDVD